MNLLLTAITPFTWGTTYVVTTEMLPDGRPILAGVMRALPAGLLLLAWFRVLPKGIWWIRAIVLGVVNIGGFFALLFLTAYLLPGGTAAVITSTAPLVVMGLSPLLLGVKVYRAQVVAGVIAVAGVAALVLSPDAALNTEGVAAAVAATLFTGTGLVLAKRWGRPEGVPQLAVTGWQLTFGGLALMPLLLFEGLPDHLTGTNIAGYTYLTVVGALIAYGLWFRGLAILDAVSVSLLSVINPLTATVLGVIVKGESFSAIQAVGAVTVIVAASAAQIVGARARKREAANA
ncbi:EamA family transporter [Corynebacterium sp. TAE3-ERU16]|uniref:EamA family transporter n=1 Tax=Corynebacterium sp. TAE3-ERU16 TaxID=2849493 RepID=UPI001C485109|nr:EamA family transporter [Corynebacterium sp. TAE3-ERU16]MBV7293860.1 EamA family transporter [Corynebacterium sp. TAE3-ERU16]